MSVLRAVGAVASSMIGIRRGDRAARDFAQLRAWHVIVAAVCMVGALVAGLITMASYIAQ